MLRKAVIGAASGLSFVMLGVSPSFALDALMLPNSQSASMPYASDGLTSTDANKDKDSKSSFHFSVSGNSDGRSRDLFAPNSFGPNSDASNPMGPTPTYGPPQQWSDPFFHN